MNHWLIIAAVCPLLLSSCAARPPKSNRLDLKIIVSWSIPLTDKGIDDAVAKAKALGFNAYAWTTSAKEKEFIAACRKHGLATYRVLEPLRKRPGAAMQVMLPGEEKLPGFRGQVNAEFQYGGEPAPGNREVLQQDLVCPLDPGVVDDAINQATKAVALGYDGVCWDFVGYQNYHSCECPRCIEQLGAFRKSHPALTEPEARNAFYEQSLVDLYAALYDRLKQAAPGMKVMCHCHPVYLPNPFYGHRIKVDYCGITVAWFFKPHWSMDKVKDYADRTANADYEYVGAVGMPMIGFYSMGELAPHRRSGERLKQELQAVKDAGAKAIMLCELGNILNCDDAAEAVANVLNER